jgi:threonine/homoserine/homoserine lactone efflux protein
MMRGPVAPCGMNTMHAWLPSGPLLAAFLLASFVLAVTPGPGVLYVVTRSLAEGRWSGMASVAGVALGNLANAIGASLGIAAIFAVSSIAFSIVKYAGAAYLIYLGIQALRAPASSEPSSAAPAPRSRIFRDGFMVALLNPKTAMFFAAFLPQFMNTDAVPAAQSIVLGSVFVAMAVVTDSLYVLAASAIAPFLARRRGVGAIGRHVSGCTFIGLGILSAFGSRQTR